MIFGIGTDILEISRIDKILKKYNQTFVNRIFGSNEIKIIENKSKNMSFFLAKRFAAKEALWKALSPKRGDGLVFKEIEILNNLNGKPFLFFSGRTQKYIMNKEIELNKKLIFDISISDEPPYVLAFVVISLAPLV
jgi:holo-[acyl-carrier protein] synthase